MNPVPPRRCATEDCERRAQIGGLLCRKHWVIGMKKVTCRLTRDQRRAMARYYDGNIVQDRQLRSRWVRGL